MKKRLACALLLFSLVFSACSQQASGRDASSDFKNGEAAVSEVSATQADNNRFQQIRDSYYAAQNSPAYDYFQHNSIQRFVAMWVEEETEIQNPQWNFDSFTKIEILDHDFIISRPEQELYCCTFSDGASRYGYLIFIYYGDGPAIKNWGVTETTPFLYDLDAVLDDIAPALLETDLDLSTASASRVYLFDRENRRADQVIRFTDGNGGNYLYYLGDETFAIETVR